MNWLDRSIGWVSPSSALRRVRARAALQLATRAYDAARRDHRTMSWKAGGTDANTEIGAAEETVRNRCRELARNSGYAVQILDTFADNVVGTGIIGAPTGLSKRNQKIVSGLWTGFKDECDWDGDNDLDGLLWLACKAMAESGAAIIRFRRQRFDASTTRTPLKLQLLEPDLIDVTKTTMLADGYIDRGIEYDVEGRVRAWWLYPGHPGNMASWRSRAMTSERIPASEIVYLYDKLRPGQDRGMPLLAPAVMPLHDLRGYFDAELVRKRIESCLAAFIKPGLDGADAQIGTSTEAARPGKLAEKFEPGMIMRLRDGEEVTVSTPGSSQGVEEFATLYLREIAAGAGVMYEHVTGDFSRVNYSSWRAGGHGFRRRMERKQWHIMIHRACKPIGARFREASMAAGLLPSQDFGMRWTPPGFISVDKYKDAQGDLLDLRLGKVTPSQLVEANGYDYLEFLEQLAEDLAAADNTLGPGVHFDGDPRKAAPNQASANSESNQDNGKKAA
ncbi:MULTISPECIES: phage portal protein [unclassified Sphingobium]|uniref:phage portal protein n=1 Tax=unclassified Sphingobium TaxID=2611147 RepID=UPI002224E85A|nr:MULTISPECIES: phage portal protein [unclassified Sphingobium]MCW2412011.1 lambda family phage portal protein [Sphingobium sp. B8D3D]MCW2415691.1 lambda family phage portal protein [Sphingobium sp. B8D3A]